VGSELEENDDGTIVYAQNGIACECSKKNKLLQQKESKLSSINNEL
jgi:hypothetical protein